MVNPVADGHFIPGGETAGSASTTDIAGLASGGFVRIWTGGPGGAGGVTVYDAGGQAGPTRELFHTAFGGSVIGLAGGGFAIAWTDNSSASATVMTQAFNAAGVSLGNAVVVNPGTNVGGGWPQLAARQDGSYVIAWNQSDAVFSTGIKARTFDSHGVALSDPVQVAGPDGASSPGYALRGDITTLADGRSVVSMIALAPGFAAARIVDLAGNAKSANFVERDPSAGKTYNFASSTLLASGKILFAYAVQPAAMAGGVTSVHGEILNTDGTSTGVTFDHDIRSDFSITALPDGSFALGYSNPAGSHVYAQLYSANAATIGDPILLDQPDQPYLTDPIVGSFGSNNLAAAWTYGPTSSAASALELFFGPNFGTAAGETLTGTANADAIYGLDGDDTLQGLGGDDILFGGNGADHLDGGSGSDTASYADYLNSNYSSEGVTIDLGTGTAHVGPAEGDVLVSIENVIGTPYFDTLTGDAGDNRLDGGAAFDRLSGGDGNDVLVGGADDDALDGGNGRDIAVINATRAQSTFSLNSTDLVVTSPDGTDVLKNVEVLRFTDQDIAYVVSQAGGTATLNGGSGKDVLMAFGNGSTTINGFGGNDTLIGGASHDILVGGDGDDTYYLTPNSYDGSAPDDIVEAPGGGNDTVITQISIVLPDNVETMRLADNVLLGKLTGNAAGGTLISNNTWGGTLQGGSGAIRLVSGAQNDTLIGGSGVATAVIDDAMANSTIVAPTPIKNGNVTTYPANAATVTSTGHGTDTLSNITKIEFSDGIVYLLNVTTIDQAYVTSLGRHATTSEFATASSLAQLQAPASVAAVRAALNLPEPVTKLVSNDFNGDGKSDILWRSTSGQLVDWLATGSGSFSLNQTNVGVSTDWKIAGTGDFNGDGKSDILWRNADGRLGDWFGTGAGTFTPNATVYSVGIDWQIAGTGDFNGDGQADLLWRNADGRVATWAADAAGNFAPTATITPVSSDWKIAGTGDFNGDGKTDLLWRNADGRVATWAADAAGNFTPTATITPVGNDWHIAGTGDFNGDGRSDMLWRNDAGQIDTWMANANGTFTPSGKLADIAGVWSVAGTGDYDGDGKSDILWRNSSTGLAGDWLSKGDGTFTSNLSLATTFFGMPLDWNVAGTITNPAPIAHVANDFNGDGRSDILWRNASLVGDWFGSGPGNFAVNPAVIGVSSDWKIAGTGDFNGDGRADILWRNADGRLGDWFGNGAGNFTPNATVYSVGNDWQIAGTGDFNGDGKSDLLWRNADGRVATWAADAAGNFAPTAIITPVSNDWKIAGTGDFNGDGREDILWRNTSSGQVATWSGNTDHSFVMNAASATSPLSWHIAETGDFNGDGRSDILWRNDAGQIDTWMANANGTFTPSAKLYDVGNEWKIVDVGDYNGDGNADILWRNINSGQVSDWIGSGNGTFTPNTNLYSAPLDWNVAGDHAFLV